MRARWILVPLMLVACKKGQGTDQPAAKAGSSVGSAGSAAPAPAAWSIASQPVELLCPSTPPNQLPLPAPAAAGSPAADRPLPHADAIKDCQDQASVAAVCECLVKSIKTWGDGLGLSPTVQCEQPPLPGLVLVSSTPADDTTSGGEAYVFVAKHGDTWSPVAVVAGAPDVDLSVTPKASHTVKIDRVESEALASGDLYWFESHHEAQDKDMSETEHEGEAHGTVCIVPAGGAAYCGKPLLLGSWSYTFDMAKAESPDACKLAKASAFTATVDAKSVTVKLAHGSDTAGVAGRYVF